MIHLCANKSAITATELELLVSGSQNIHQVGYCFSGDWDGLAREAMFRAGSSEPVTVLLGPDNRCALPWEVLAEEYAGRAIYAGVRGTDGDNQVILPTIWCPLGMLRKGVGGDGSETKPPTPDMYQQILTAAEQAVDTAQSVRADADNGAFIGKPGPPGPPGPPGQNAASGDWGQNDPESPEHIKNRTHYVDESGAVHPLPGKFLPEGAPWVEYGEVLPELTFTGEAPEGWDYGNGMWVMNTAPGFSICRGEAYTVRYNGAAYTCVGKDFAPDGVSLGAALGNVERFNETGDSGEPFVLAVVEPWAVGEMGAYGGLVDVTGGEARTISIEGGVGHPIDPRCLPDDVGGGKKVYHFKSTTSLDDVIDRALMDQAIVEHLTGRADIYLDGYPASGFELVTDQFFGDVYYIRTPQYPLQRVAIMDTSPLGGSGYWISAQNIPDYLINNCHLMDGKNGFYFAGPLDDTGTWSNTLCRTRLKIDGSSSNTALCAFGAFIVPETEKIVFRDKCVDFSALGKIVVSEIRGGYSTIQEYEENGITTASPVAYLPVPEPTDNDSGKVLCVVDGELAWVEADGGPSGLMRVVEVPYAAEVELAANTVTEIAALEGPVSLTIASGPEGYANTWVVYITQPETAQDVALPVVEWAQGIAPAFDAGATRELRLYYAGDTLKGVWS